MTVEEVAALQKNLEYYKELYELEKETNELNSARIEELNAANRQDCQRYTREIGDLKSHVRRLESSAKTSQENSSVTTALRQKVHQLEREVTSLTDRVRIAENLATKLEENCRAKDFKIAEQQKDYDLVLAKCNAFELMMMSTSHMDGFTSMNQSVFQSSTDCDENDVNGLNGTLLNGRDIPEKYSPNTDTSADTEPQSPTIREQNGVADFNLNSNTDPKKTSLLSPSADLQKMDVDTARKYCEANPNEVESLLEFAEMLRTVRRTPEISDLDGYAIRSGKTGKVSPMVRRAMASVEDLQREFAKLVVASPALKQRT